MRKSMIAMVVLLAGLLAADESGAHFGMVIPSDSMVMADDGRNVTVTLAFAHPFEGQGMELAKPEVFKVVANGEPADLLDRLQPTRVMAHGAWQADYAVKRPGVYMFYMQPRPYWEPAEDVFIIHYTKSVVTAFGDDEGWDAEIGLKTEIAPLAKPFGQYAGNVFQGIVKLEAEPVPYAEVEVEYYNRDGTAAAPTDYMVTQTIKADRNGVFTYAAPHPGWWGFAALNEADFTLKLDSGEEKGVELGAVLWIYFHPWQSR